MWSLLFTILFMSGGEVQESHVTLGLFGNFETCEAFRQNLIEGKFERQSNLHNVSITCTHAEIDFNHNQYPEKK